VFGAGVTVEDNAVIRSFSHLDRAHVGKGASVGPYARLRPGARLEEDVHIGNFVEVKEAVIETGAKANHLSYIGDATVGEGAYVGSGSVITRDVPPDALAVGRGRQEIKEGWARRRREAGPATRKKAPAK
jgi:bifunctional UDP-N-acetylglucosamine pyrophosphorylase/glucosamine-1-phosphate N-acetyltransferase